MKHFITYDLTVYNIFVSILGNDDFAVSVCPVGHRNGLSKSVWQIKQLQHLFGDNFDEKDCGAKLSFL